MENSKEIKMQKCDIETDGNITCKITKSAFNEMQKQNIKPKRVILEID